jgi:predicted RNA-binding Zn-ribbon protein involved in translation (DUF1610 family)
VILPVFKTGARRLRDVAGAFDSHTLPPSFIMGQQYRFTCPACGYKADVSGGDDAGRIVATATILCADCAELQDVATASLAHPHHTSSAIHCERSVAHRVRRWKHPGPCPVCGATMNKGKLVLLWD